MRILHLIPSVDPNYGGPIEGLLKSHLAFPPSEQEQREIACLDPHDAAFLYDLPIKVHALGGASNGKGPIGRFLDHYRYSPSFAPWIKANASRFDTVIVHGLWNYTALAASQVLPAVAVPYFVFPHGMMDPWFRRRYPLKHIAKQLFWWIGEGRLLASANSVMFTCEEEKLKARGTYLGYNYTEAVVGFGTAAPPPATPEDASLVMESIPGLEQAPFLLYLSRIHEKKGCDLLIEGFSRCAADLNELKLVIAGPGDPRLLRKLRTMIADRGMAGRILMPGPLFGAKKWAGMRCAEAFILPSHQENFGVVVAEALACGTPVLISDKVNIWREVETAKAGFVAPDTVIGVEQLLIRWLKTSRERRGEMATAASRLFEEMFNVRETAPALISFLEKNLVRP